MRNSRWLGLAALLAAAACNARSGNFGVAPADDAASGTDAVSTGDSATADTTAAPDVPVGADVVVGPDVVEGPDVVVGPDVVEGPDVVVNPIDVPVGPRCGDGTCNPGETCESCRADCASTCPPPPDVPTTRCGDGTCNSGETCESCRADCGPCMPTGAVTDPCPSGATQGPNRNCGWRAGMTFSCSPGRATMVGCSGSAGMGSLCQPSYGVCMGDPVIRVCPGTAPCPAAMALTASAGSFDDQCGTCPSAYVTCPASGQIHVLSGDYDSNNPMQRGTCTPAVR